MSTRQETLHRNTFEVNAQSIINGIGGVFGQIFRLSESVTIPMPSSITTSTASVDPSVSAEIEPFIPVYGRFKDDPTWDRFMQNIEEYSQEVDAMERSKE